MIKSEITGKMYEPSTAIYITNQLQNARYIEYLGFDCLLDIILSDKSTPKMLAFAWKRCPETKRAKELWDEHKL